MPRVSPVKAKIVKDAIRRFSHLGNQPIARYVLATQGEMWDNDLQKIRAIVRYYTGSSGKRARKEAADKSLFRDTVTKMPKTWRTIRTPHHLDPGLWLILSDIHIPFHEPLPLEAAVQAGQAEKIDGILFNGDVFDYEGVGFWHTHRRDFNRELGMCIDFLDWIQNQFPKAKKVYKPGNHEYRLPRYFISNAPELIETPYAAMETVMDFDGRGIEFLDYHQIVRAGKLPIFHGHEIKNLTSLVNPARGLFLRTNSYAACGHCHSTSTHSERNVDGKDLTCHSFGCLCSLSPDWQPYTNKWNWGFALINVEKDGNFEIVNRRILDNGKVV